MFCRKNAKRRNAKKKSRLNYSLACRRRREEGETTCWRRLLKDSPTSKEHFFRHSLKKRFEQLEDRRGSHGKGRLPGVITGLFFQDSLVSCESALASGNPFQSLFIHEVTNQWLEGFERNKRWLHSHRSRSQNKISLSLSLSRWNEKVNPFRDTKRDWDHLILYIHRLLFTWKRDKKERRRSCESTDDEGVEEGGSLSNHDHRRGEEIYRLSSITEQSQLCDLSSFFLNW